MGGLVHAGQEGLMMDNKVGDEMVDTLTPGKVGSVCLCLVCSTLSYPYSWVGSTDIVRVFCASWLITAYCVNYLYPIIVTLHCVYLSTQSLFVS